MEPIELKVLLEQESDLGKVIHTQIIIENMIREYLDNTLRYPKHLKPMNLDYFQVVQLALAMGLNEKLDKPLRILAKIRNVFAHQLDTKIDSNYMNNFYDSFPQEQKEKIMKVARDTNQTWVTECISWKKVKLDQRFQYLCFTLYYWCKLEIEIQRHDQLIDKLGRSALNLLPDN
jgi:hypothetical protein